MCFSVQIPLAVETYVSTLHSYLIREFLSSLFGEIESAHEKNKNQIKTLPLAATIPWEEYFWRIFLRPDLFPKI